tara:strand:- start:14199 stop:14729 length:531 start_codon:yes stop_codon:yes gene_type:complete
MHNKNTIHELIREFYPYAKEKMGFNKPCRVFLRENKENYADPLGKTAYYDPQGMEIHLFTTGRHPKDVMRSFSHELVHHTQNCRGSLDSVGPTAEGYAQNNKHLREMEKEAYLEGNLCFRDWTDTREKNNQGIAKHRGDGTNDQGSIPLRNNDREEWLGPAGNHSAHYSKGNRDPS